MNKFGIISDKNESKNLSNVIYGNRFHADQTLYEYLIEFLLIFISPKSSNNNYSEGQMQFHNNTNELKYYAERKMGLKRFIFYNSSKKDTSIPYDKDAYDYLNEELISKTDKGDAQQLIYNLQDLFRGYAVVLKKRSWCAQQTLPICPELIFCEAMPDKKYRSEHVLSGKDISVDSTFEFTKRNFLARGGELYYLHILQALENENYEHKEELELLLKILLTRQSSQLSQIARFIQDTWVEKLGGFDKNKENLYQSYTLAWIPTNAYGDSGKYTVKELLNYLSANIQQIKKIEVLAEGVMLQILRMLHVGACNEAKLNVSPWILDVTNGDSNYIRKISSSSFRKVEDDFKIAIDAAAREQIVDPDELPKAISDAQKESIDIFRSKGKEIRCIVPLTGAFERFSLSENSLRFLVLSIIEPGGKMTLDTFMDKLYEHYHMIIGPKQFKRFVKDESAGSDSVYLDENVRYFQDYLNSIGCLRELSDATSVVLNPYSNVERD